MTYRKISELHEWDKNPRTITVEAYDRLKRQIQKFGQYKPIIITDDGTVIGGNMRLKAYRELGIEEVWVSIVNAESDKQKMEYALSDNDRSGFYDEDLLANLTGNMPDIQWNDYSIDTKEPLALDKIIEEASVDREPRHFQVIVDCKDRNKQKEVYEKLFDMGLDVKTLTK